MGHYIARVEATKVHGRFDIEQDFKPGINVLFGKNGTGKTTLLHIIANALNGEDYHRFRYLKFDTIQIDFNNGDSIKIVRKKDDSLDFYQNGDLSGTITSEDLEQIRFDRRSAKSIRTKVEIPPPFTADYFPAFRNMIEAWDTVDERLRPRPNFEWEPRDPRWNPTNFARKLFGAFVPDLNYPSPIEIEEKLTEEIKTARISVGATDRRLLSQAFREIYRILAEAPDSEQNPEKILKEIEELSQQLQATASLMQTESMLVGSELDKLLRSVQQAQPMKESEKIVAPMLDVYRKSLQEIVSVQNNEFMIVRKYLESVNKFLDGKYLAILPEPSINGVRKSLISLVFEDKSTSPLGSLSSGERQIVTLIYAATHMREEQVVLIDEPEISLHIDWQRNLLSEMETQLQDRQVIACTHSPEIGVEYDDDRVFELSLKPSCNSHPVKFEQDMEDECEDVEE